MPDWTWRFAHLAVLWAFAVVQPLLDVLGKNAEFFVARGNGAVDIVVFSLALALVPPLLLLGAEALAGLVSRRLARALHLAFVGLLVAAFVLQLLDSSLETRASVLILAALAVGALAALAYARNDTARWLVSFLSPAPVVFLVLFLFFSDAAKVVLPEDEVEALAAGSGNQPVVMVVFDELPTASLLDHEGKINARRFPSFAALAREGTWYENATTVADHTDDAVPAMLSGIRPATELDPLAADYPDNLFTLLAGSQNLNVREASTQLCPQSFCDAQTESFVERMRSLVDDLAIVSGRLLLPESLEEELPAVDQGFADFGAAADAKEGAHDLPNVGVDQEEIDFFLAGIESEPRSLHYLHVLVPHLPWRYLPTGQDYQRGEVIWNEWHGSDQLWAKDARAVSDQALRAHLLQTGFADRLLGQIMQRVRAAGVWDDAAIVVVADHGANFAPGTHRRLIEPANAGALAPVPLLIKEPGQEQGRRDANPATTIDILPTVADLLEIDLPFEVEGAPASGLGPAPRISVLRSEEQEPRTFDLDQTLAQRDRIAARAAELFGDGWQGVYEYGLRPDLVGRRVASLEELPPVGSEAFSLANAEVYEDVDLDGAFLPALIYGTPEGVPNGSPVAFALNGRIVAVSPVYDSKDKVQRAAALASPKDFVEGANGLAIYRVIGGTDARLRPLSGASP